MQFGREALRKFVWKSVEAVEVCIESRGRRRVWRQSYHITLLLFMSSSSAGNRPHRLRQPRQFVLNRVSPARRRVWRSLAGARKPNQRSMTIMITSHFDNATDSNNVTGSNVDNFDKVVGGNGDDCWLPEARRRGTLTGVLSPFRLASSMSGSGFRSLSPSNIISYLFIIAYLCCIYYHDNHGSRGAPPPPPPPPGR